MKWDREISVGMPIMKCATKPSTKTFNGKNATCPIHKSYNEEKERKGKDPDIDTTRSVDNVALEIENGEVMSYDNIPDNAEKFTSKYYLDRIDELTNSMNEERDFAKSQLSVVPEKAKARPYRHIQKDVVSNLNIIFKPKMEQINEMPKEIQQEFFTDMYKCAYDTIQELCQSDKIKGTTNNRVALTNATIHNDELAPHMHTDFTVVGQDKNGFLTYSYNKVFSNTREGATNGLSNMNHIIRDKMRELGWSIKEIVDTSEMTVEEKRKYRKQQGQDSEHYKFQQERKAEKLKTENKELQNKNDKLKEQIESGKEANKDLDKELTKKMDKYDDLEIKNENKEKELSDKNKKIDETDEELKNKNEQIKNANENIQRLQQEHEQQLEKNRQTKDITTEEYKKELKLKTTSLSNEISPKYTGEKSLGLGKGSIEVVDKETLLKSDELLKTKDKLNKTLEIQHEEDQSTIKELEQKVENLQNKESVQAYEELQNKNNQQQAQIYQLKKDNEDLRYNTVPLEEAEELQKNNKILKNMLKNVSAIFWNVSSHTPFKTLVEKILTKAFPPEFIEEIKKASNYRNNELLKDTFKDEDFSKDEKNILLQNEQQQQQQQQLQEDTTSEAME